jgi:thiamine kinase-like enzyme
MPAQPVLDFSNSAELQGNLPENPALRAWSKVQPNLEVSIPVETIRQRAKSAIYRLQGAGPNCSDIIAKRCLSTTALTERLIYQEILPSLPLAGLRCYGCVKDDAPEFHWLFIEDAGTLEYEVSLPEHRAAAARWMAQLHSLGAGSAAAARLPDRGTRFYLEQLRLARKTIVKNYSNPALQGADLAEVKALEAQCEFVEARWEQVQQMCQGMPSTLVHSDLKVNNVRMRHETEGLTLLPFDWELAGWGIPVVDILKCPDHELYFAEVSKAWPSLKREHVQRLAEVGKLFRAIITVSWNSVKLRFPWIEWAMLKLRIPQAALTQAIEVLGIK